MRLAHPSNSPVSSDDDHLPPVALSPSINRSLRALSRHRVTPAIMPTTLPTSHLRGHTCREDCLLLLALLLPTPSDLLDQFYRERSQLIREWEER